MFCYSTQLGKQAIDNNMISNERGCHIRGPITFYRPCMQNRSLEGQSRALQAGTAHMKRHKTYFHEIRKNREAVNSTMHPTSNITSTVRDVVTALKPVRAEQVRRPE